MWKYLEQLWRSPDLRRRILYTLGLLLIYRIIAHVPIPGADPFALRQFLQGRSAGGVLGVFTALTGGSLDRFSIVLLGLSPYINASIIMQLCTVIFPKLEALGKEGVQGQQQINRYTRFLTLPLAFVQSYAFLILLSRGGAPLIELRFPDVLLPMLFVTAGSMFLMWLGEVLTEKGIGNGTSLIIFTGIITGMPKALNTVLYGQGSQVSMFFLFALISLAMLIAVVLFTDAHRLIPITYANQGAGRGVQGGLPIRLNQAGMVPIIFAVSLISFPSLIAQLLGGSRLQSVVSFINSYVNPQNPSFVYLGLYFLLVVLFTFFYVSVTFKPVDVAEQIQKRGGFIPGIRPGVQTANMLTQVSNRLSLWGGVFLAAIAIIPLVFTKQFGVSSSELLVSGSGLIIIVGVIMEIIRQVNAQMLAHDYDKLV